jgi:hypothetical protein
LALALALTLVLTLALLGDTLAFARRLSEGLGDRAGKGLGDTIAFLFFGLCFLGVPGGGNAIGGLKFALLARVPSS